MDPPQLLVSVPSDDRTRSAIERALPHVGFVFTAERPGRPWAGIRALLVGNPDRELPELRPGDLPDLKFVQTIYTGLDGFPFDRLPSGARVAGNVAAYAPFVAEHAVALLLASARDLVEGNEMVRAGKLRPVERLTYLGGKTVVLVGFGGIAQEVVLRLRSFGVRFVGVDRTGAPHHGVDRMLPIARLGDALAEADAIVDCLPLTRSTHGLFDTAMFARIRPGAIFVNVGRAETVVPAALAAKLREDPRFRAASDVWWEEDFEAGTIRHPFPVAEQPHLIGSPHRAGIVPESRAYILDRALENLQRFFAGEVPRHLADPAEYAP